MVAQNSISSARVTCRLGARFGIIWTPHQSQIAQHLRQVSACVGPRRRRANVQKGLMALRSPPVNGKLSDKVKCTLTSWCNRAELGEDTGSTLQYVASEHLRPAHAGQEQRNDHSKLDCGVMLRSFARVPGERSKRAERSAPRAPPPLSLVGM